MHIHVKIHGIKCVRLEIEAEDTIGKVKERIE